MKAGFLHGKMKTERKSVANGKESDVATRRSMSFALNLHHDREQYIRLGDKILSPLLMELLHLKYLDRSHNYFDGLVSYLGNLSRLQYLDLSNIDTHNYGFGSIKWLSCLSNLEYLDLNHNQIQDVGWLKIISGLTKLSTLRFTACFPPPPSLSSLSHINASSTSLTAIYLGNNFLTFSIFQLLLNSSSTANLVFLDLSTNELSGSIPESFGNLCNLRVLDLSQNKLRGQLGFVIICLPV
ncbi:hypothetical protein TIFTF001_014099 [Ficus carica]|uniref:Uncharacterized protein n=1 Tax=Ficus carica TaxID=3494 RepID=A0AA88AFF4_FICCA|nr:hypothetical protein TIFTF001_014099 [Ficus carica]